MYGKRVSVREKKTGREQEIVSYIFTRKVSTYRKSSS